jgi:predicted DNA-binding protein YlxM (UPF0122 family)
LASLHQEIKRLKDKLHRHQKKLEKFERFREEIELISTDLVDALERMG